MSENKPNTKWGLPSSEEMRTEVSNSPLLEMGMVGSVWNIRMSDLSTQVANLIAETWNIPELIDVMILPDYSRQIGNLTGDTRAYAVFDCQGVDPASANIWMTSKGSRNNEGRRMAVDVSSHSGINGRFSTNEHFTKKMLGLVADRAIDYRSNNQAAIIIEEHPSNPNIPIVELDLLKILQIALNVKEDYINFRIMDAQEIGGGNNRDYNLLLIKYIDTSNATRRNRNRGRGLDIGELRNGLANRYGKRGGGNNGGNRGGRGF